MPDRATVMISVHDYLRARERAREPMPIVSAYISGGCLLLLGAAMLAVPFLSALQEPGLILASGFILVQLGVAFMILGKKGGARYRVTETTRYPQQTGEIMDMYSQILGENYQWMAIGFLILWFAILLCIL